MNTGGHLEVFFGEATASEARIYASCTGEFPPGAELRGSVTGPSCAYAQTLPAITAIRHVHHRDQQLLAAATLPDPCFWSPELPHVYEVELQVHCEGKSLVSAVRLFGIQPLGIKQRSLYREGKRFVVRGGAGAVHLEDHFNAFHDCGLAMVCDQAAMPVCEQASRAGVLLVVRLSGSVAESREELELLSRWPASRMVVVAADVYDEVKGDRPRNMLLGCAVTTPRQAKLAPQAEFLLVEASSTAAIEQQLGALEHDRPLLVRLTAPTPHPPDSIRPQCDQLQRALAPIGDFAGYLV